MKHKRGDIIKYQDGIGIFIKYRNEDEKEKTWGKIYWVNFPSKSWAEGGIYDEYMNIIEYDRKKRK